MPSRSALIMIGAGISDVLRGRDSARTPRGRRRSTAPRSSRPPRLSESTIVTPEFRNASSRSRCSSVAKSNSVMVKVCGDGRNVTSVPRLSLGLADHRQRRLRVAVAESHGVLLAVAPDAQLEPLGQRVDDRDADAVQAAGHLVGVLVEFSAGVQLGHDDLGRRDAFVLVDVDRDAAAVVAHRARTVGVERRRRLRSRAPPAPRRWRCRRPRRPCGAGPSRHRCRRYTCPGACAPHRGP